MSKYISETEANLYIYFHFELEHLLELHLHTHVANMFHDMERMSSMILMPYMPNTQHKTRQAA
jgi:hypothetical protein